MTASVSLATRLGRAIDQPLLVNKLFNWSPAVLVGLNTVAVAKDVYQAKPENRKRVLIKDLSISAGALGGAWYAFNRFMKPKPHGMEEMGEALITYVRQKVNPGIGTLADEVAHLTERLETSNGRALRKTLRQELETKSKALETQIEALVENHQNLPEGIQQHLKTFLNSKNKELSIIDAQKYRVDLFKAILTEGYGDSPNRQALLHILNNSGDKVLSVKTTGELLQNLKAVEPDKAKAYELLQLIIPQSSAKSYREMLGELMDLSMTGLLPVVGGIAGGLTGNLINREKDWGSRFGVQIQEGFYQFFANIILCNIGAALMLLGLARAPFIASHVKNNQGARLGAMLVGIVGLGMIAGSTIANFFGQNFIKPVADHGLKGGFHEVRDKIHHHGWGSLFKNLFADRTQRVMDGVMHVDDIMALGYVSGLKVIGPVVPWLYWGSGFLAGSEFRNGKNYQQRKKLSADNIKTPSKKYHPTQNTPSRPVDLKIYHSKSAHQGSTQQGLIQQGSTPLEIIQKSHPLSHQMQPPVSNPLFSSIEDIQTIPAPQSGLMATPLNLPAPANPFLTTRSVLPNWIPTSP